MLNEAGNKPLLRAQIARRGPRQGTSHPCAHKSRAGDPGREQGNKKTGEHIARRHGHVQPQAVILSEVEGSAVAFEGASALKERTRSK
jgi:hypothetical protein